MLSQAKLEKVFDDLGISAPVRFDRITSSTNAAALELAEAGAAEWTLVAAGHQTAGRGRLGRTWRDRPGESLLFSVVLRPEIPPEPAGLISLLAGAAMAVACREVCGVRSACRWPNDIHARGRKVGGILAESTIEDGRVRHVALGIGVNLGAPPAEVPEAGGLGGCDPAALLSEFVRGFRSLYVPSDPAFAAGVLSAYRAVCATLGERIRATTVEGATIEGRAVHVDERGALVVETARGRETVAFGDVEHLASGP